MSTNITITVENKCGLSFRGLTQKIFTDLNPRDWSMHQTGNCGFLGMAYTDYTESVENALPDSEIVYYLSSLYKLTWDEACEVVLHLIKLGFIELAYKVDKFSPSDVLNGPWTKLLKNLC